jgi:glycosyltransferase involved in cell wall biosynthesis
VAPLRIGVDARHLAAGRGVARYTAAMLGALARSGYDELRLLVPGRGPLALDPPRAPDVAVIRHRLPSRALFGAAAVVRRPALDALTGGDVVWLPAPAPVAVGRAPYVLTLHDLSWVHHPEWFTRYERLWHRLGRLRALAAGASCVVAVSAATRDDALATWGLDPARVRVVRSGVPEPAPPAPRPPWLPDRYVLAVGALEPRKDPELLVEAHALARRRGLDAELVLAGTGRLASAVRRPGVQVIEDAGGPLLQRLYADALALAAPARHEGFGFAPLEAALAGTPSVVADLPVYGETLGEAALRAPAGDVAAWSDALLRIATDRALADRLAAQAAAAARALSWERAAGELRAALEEAAATGDARGRGAAR